MEYHESRKQVRLQRIFNRETGRAIIVPMDHGVSVGPIEGIENIHKTVSDMADGGADAVLMHKAVPLLLPRFRRR